MRKYILPILFTLTVISAGAQKTNLPGLEDLKKELQTLKKNKWVDKANEIASTYGIMGKPKFLQRADSINRYANLALNEAVKIGYKKGIAYAYLNLAAGEKIRSTGLQISNQDVLPAAEKMLDFLIQSLQLANELKDDDLLGSCLILYSSYPWSDSKVSQNKLKKINEYINGNEAGKLFHKTGNEKNEGEAYTWMAEGAAMNGNYEKAFEYGQIAIHLNQKTIPLSKTKEEQSLRVYLYQQSLVDMANLYKEAGDFHTALEYLNRGEQYGKTYKNNWHMEREKAEVFILLGKYDSAFVFLNKIRNNSPDNAWTKLSLGQSFLAINQTDSALYFLQDALTFFKKNNNQFFTGPVMLELSSVYILQKEYNIALSYVLPAVVAADTLNDKPRPFLMKGYELLSRVYHGLGNNDSAYFYLLKYNVLKDSIQNRQFLFRISAAKKEATIGLLEKDNKIKQQQLKQEASLKYFLLIAMLLFTISGIFIFRSLILKRKNDKLRSHQLENELKMQQLENEKKQTEFQKKTTELEMQALRAQMNPHFIFNCLSSINRFILKNEPDAASDYLTRFSRLIRMVLMNSQKSTITLEDELDMLTIYLDMERLRFKNNFDYHIVFTNRVDAGAVFIPPLLLQPFCENAIWHGLKHLADPQSGRLEHGRLDIVLSMENKVLNCSITDNGIGRQKAAEIKSKSVDENKSMGLKITSERLALLNQEKEVNTSFEIVDLKNENGEVAGTTVKLKISLSETVEEYVS